MANVDQLWALIGQVVDVVCGSRGAREIQFRSRPDQRGTPAKSGPSPKLESATRSTGVPHLRQNKRRPLSMGGKPATLGAKPATLDRRRPQLAQNFSNNHPGSRDSAQARPKVVDVCPRLVTSGQRCQHFAQIGQRWSNIAKAQSKSTNSDTNSGNIGQQFEQPTRSPVATQAQTH